MQLAQSLTQDFLKEGFLFKTGPKPSDGFKRRWFTLDGRKLMYHEQKLVQRYFLKKCDCGFDEFISRRILILKERYLSAIQAMATASTKVNRLVGNYETWVSFFT